LHNSEFERLQISVANLRDQEAILYVTVFFAKSVKLDGDVVVIGKVLIISDVVYLPDNQLWSPFHEGRMVYLMFKGKGSILAFEYESVPK